VFWLVNAATQVARGNVAEHALLFFSRFFSFKGALEHLPKEAGYWAILYWHTLAGGNGKLES
jgi:hypothetical protein